MNACMHPRTNAYINASKPAPPPPSKPPQPFINHSKAIEYYQQALDLNKRLPQALNNIAVLYHSRAEEALKNNKSDVARLLFSRGTEYWKEAIRLAPSNYIEAQNWLKITGKLDENDVF